MRTWLSVAFQGAVLMVLGVTALGFLVWWLGRCRHPNPHYIRPHHRGASPDQEPATYYCYECGKTWRVESRDPAWHPTRLIQKFTGFDQGKAVAAASRAATEARQHQRIAVQRGTPAAGTPAGSRPRQGRRPHADVVDLTSRRPA